MTPSEVAVKAIILGILLFLVGDGVMTTWSHQGSQRSSDSSTAIESFKANSLITVACVGDSITSYGCASSDNMTYVAQLGRLLGEEHYQVTNYGSSGHTMSKEGYCASDAVHQCSGDCSYWDSNQYQDAIASNPDIVTIMLGTNDAKGCNWYGPPNGKDGLKFYRDYVDMIKVFQSLPSNPKVYLVIPPPLVNPPKHPEKPPPYNMTKVVLNEIIPQTLPMLGSVTGADGVIDIWTALGGTDAYENTSMTCDGCHPKDQAMTIIAQTIAKAIRQEGKEEVLHYLAEKVASEE